ncbi:PucR family transcriptional regulator [Rhodococcus hoagii]|nr:PucR family transcriptional regulator [Prescottella equi]
MNRTPITVEQLLELGAIPEHLVIGGRSGLARSVARVFPCTDAHDLTGLEPDTLIVFPCGTIELNDLATDLAIRLARSVNAAGVVTQASGRPTAMATGRLADALSIPLIVVDGPNIEKIIAKCDPYVRAPEIEALRMLGETVERFLVPPVSADELIDKLRIIFKVPVALVDSEGRLVAGDPDCQRHLSTSEARETMAARCPHAGPVETDGGGVVLLQPVRTDRGAPANLWLVAVVGGLPERLRQPILHALGVAALSYAGHVASQVASIERDSRHRSMLLSELLESEEVSASTLEKTSALRWPLGGRHTVVYIMRRSGQPEPDCRVVATSLERLVGQKFASIVIEQSDGYVFWTTGELPDADPPATDTTQQGLAEAVRGLMLSIDPEDEWGLCAGVGSAEFGASGIKRSLTAARKAALVAQGRADSHPVEHSSAVSAAGMLAGWFDNQALHEAASELLDPLLRTDPSRELLRTLRCYLDHESSATSAAEHLGVHRNTVLLRLERIRVLLDLDLGKAEDRLVLQLATRALIPQRTD